ncbi:MAG: FAD-dependent oxidoreductase [Thermodesulfobacteriota bacterium]
MIDFNELSIEKEVLIIGGGIAGITAALELAQLGIPLILIEKNHKIGGLAASFCCKASEACNKCFACVVDKKILEVNQKREISILTQTEVIGIKRNEKKFEVLLKKGRERINLQVSAIVIAVGIDPFDARQKGEYGYGRYANVITAKDLDEMLRYQGNLVRPSDGRLPERIAFFQCVGSRDESIGNLYCSQICCAYALRLIKAIRYHYPKVELSFFYMDIQPAGPSFQSFLQSCREDKGIRFIRSLPSKIYFSPSTNLLKVRVPDPEKGEVVEEIFDLIVLSVGMVLNQGAKSLFQWLDLTYTEDGFIAPEPIEKGLFIAGACSGPKDIDHSILHSKSIVYSVYQFVRGKN